MRAVSRPVEVLEIEVTLNGEPARRSVPARLLLSDLLRDGFGLTGTRVGCEQGSCGACTVLVDRAPVRACLMLAVQADGTAITTVEGLTPADGLSPMQAAFAEHHALQCGFCTAGFLTTLAAVDPHDYPDEASVRRLLAGNLCRCTGYESIVAAVRAAWNVR